MEKQKKLKPDQLSHNTLQPLIDWCEVNKSHGGGTKGALSEVMKRYEEITGETPTRAQFQRWLHVKKNKRQHPRFGVGLILMRIHAEIVPTVTITQKG